MDNLYLRYLKSAKEDNFKNSATKHAVNRQNEIYMYIGALFDRGLMGLGCLNKNLTRGARVGRENTGGRGMVLIRHKTTYECDFLIRVSAY